MTAPDVPAAEPAPGDVVEIATPSGLAYVHVTHRHPSYPPVVRALTGLHDSPPADLAALAAGPAAFTAMVPLAQALSRLGIAWQVVARAPVSDPGFPTFRMAVRDRAGNVAYWWLWDGEGLTHTTELTEAQSALPLREVMGADSFLVRLTAPGPGHQG